MHAMVGTSHDGGSLRGQPYMQTAQAVDVHGPARRCFAEAIEQSGSEDFAGRATGCRAPTASARPRREALHAN